MNLKTEDRQIGELSFKTTQFAAMRAFALLAKLVRVAGPALGALTKLDPETELDLAGTEIAMAFASIDPKQATELVPEILASTIAIVPTDAGSRSVPLTTRENIDSVFSGNLRTLFQTIGFVLQVNYRDFIEGSAPAAPQALERSAG